MSFGVVIPRSSLSRDGHSVHKPNAYIQIELLTYVDGISHIVAHWAAGSECDIPFVRMGYHTVPPQPVSADPPAVITRRVAVSTPERPDLLLIGRGSCLASASRHHVCPHLHARARHTSSVCRAASPGTPSLIQTRSRHRLSPAVSERPRRRRPSIVSQPRLSNPRGVPARPPAIASRTPWCSRSSRVEAGAASSRRGCARAV